MNTQAIEKAPEADPYGKLLPPERKASSPPSESGPVRKYTAADFDRLAHSEAEFLGVPEAIAWGAVFALYVLIAGCQMLIATGRHAAGDKQAAPQFVQASLIWIPGFLVLLIAWSAQWKLAPSLLLTLSSVVLAYALLRYRRSHSDMLSTKGRRLFVAGTCLWVLALQLWGFIWNWRNHFEIDQFIGLHLALPLLYAALLLAKRWVDRTGNTQT